eukprot:2088829-Pyramimonas_sp.AAC.3
MGHFGLTLEGLGLVMGHLGAPMTGHFGGHPLRSGSSSRVGGGTHDGPREGDCHGGPLLGDSGIDARAWTCLREPMWL